jgi:hypothetical protein
MFIRSGAIFIAVLILSMAGQGRVALGAGCSTTDIAAAVDQTAIARQAMLAIPIGDAHEPNIPPAARKAIAVMRRQLGVLVNAYMRCAQPDSDARSIELGLSRLIEAFGHNPANEYNYGNEITFEAERPAGHPTLVTIVADLQIECGSDPVLFVFAAEKGSWREILRWQSKPYDYVGGGSWAFDYALSPPDEGGKWYLLLKGIATSCESVWSSIRYAVLRPSLASIVPAVIYDSDGYMYWAEDDGQITAKEFEFEVRFHTRSIDPGVHNRLWIGRFKIKGNTVTRIQPVALSARDFADEWIVSSWKDAAGWTTPMLRSALRPWHDRLNKINSFLYDSVRQCSNGPDRYQIGLTDDQTSYFLLVAGSADYSMTKVSTKPDATCGGPNILEGAQPE